METARLSSPCNLIRAAIKGRTAFGLAAVLPLLRRWRPGNHTLVYLPTHFRSLRSLSFEGMLTLLLPVYRMSRLGRTVYPTFTDLRFRILSSLNGYRRAQPRPG